MNVRFINAPWVWQRLSQTVLADAAAILADYVWRDAAQDFHAERQAKLRHGRRAPKGMQPFLNQVIDSRFAQAGWEGHDGRYRRKDAWIRVTFRHQMSTGSDFLDAIKMVHKENCKVVVIIAAEHDTLKIISPNDAPALTSFEKLRIQASDLSGVTEIPLVLGALSPLTKASDEIESAIRQQRARG